MRIQIPTKRHSPDHTSHSHSYVHSTFDYRRSFRSSVPSVKSVTRGTARILLLFCVCVFVVKWSNASSAPKARQWGEEKDGEKEKRKQRNDEKQNSDADEQASGQYVPLGSQKEHGEGGRAPRARGGQASWKADDEKKAPKGRPKHADGELNVNHANGNDRNRCTSITSFTPYMRAARRARARAALVKPQEVVRNESFGNARGSMRYLVPVGEAKSWVEVNDMDAHGKPLLPEAVTYYSLRNVKFVYFVDYHGHMVRTVTHPTAKTPADNLFTTNARSIEAPRMVNSTHMSAIMRHDGNTTMGFIDVVRMSWIPVVAVEDRVVHHDLRYNPLTESFMSIEAKPYSVNLVGVWRPLLLNYIGEYGLNGSRVWSFDIWKETGQTWAKVVLSTPGHVCQQPLKERRQFNSSTEIRICTDILHCNTVMWAIAEGAVYLNCRRLNTIIKIAYPSGEVIWSLGSGGNLRLYDQNNVRVKSFFRTAHEVTVLPHGRFAAFDNNVDMGVDPITWGPARFVVFSVSAEMGTANLVRAWRPPKEHLRTGLRDLNMCSVMGLPFGRILVHFAYRGYTAEVGPDEKVVWALWNQTIKSAMQSRPLYDDPETKGLSFRAQRMYVRPVLAFPMANSTHAAVVAWDILPRTFHTRGQAIAYIAGTNDELGKLNFNFGLHWQEVIVVIPYKNARKLGEGTVVSIHVSNEEGLCHRTIAKVSSTQE